MYRSRGDSGRAHTDATSRREREQSERHQAPSDARLWMMIADRSPCRSLIAGRSASAAETPAEAKHEAMIISGPGRLSFPMYPTSAPINTDRSRLCCSTGPARCSLRPSRARRGYARRPGRGDRSTARASDRAGTPPGRGARPSGSSIAPRPARPVRRCPSLRVCTVVPVCRRCGRCAGERAV